MSHFPPENAPFLSRKCSRILRILIVAVLVLLSGWTPEFFAHAQAPSSSGTRATTRIFPDGSTSTTVTDPEKRTAEEVFKDAAGRPQKKITYLLSGNDLAEAAIYQDGKGRFIYKATYQRDAYGHVTQSAFTNEAGAYLGKRIFYYGAGDSVSRIEDYDANDHLIAQNAGTKSGARKRR